MRKHSHTPKNAGRSAQARRGARRSAPTRRGVVVLLTLMSVIVLASMVYYVHNLGRRAQLRVEVQTAADAAALSGPGWVARQLNLIAHHNLELARLFAVINVLDALPLALDAAIAEEDEPELSVIPAQVLAIEHALDQGGMPTIARRELLFTQARLQNSLQSLDNQLRDLAEQLGADNQAVQRMTRYEDESAIGHLREAMRAMDLLSQATALVVDRSAAEGALAAARASMPSGGYDDADDQFAVLASDRTPVKIVRGRFGDLGHAVRAGIIPPMAFDRTAARYEFTAATTLYTVTESGLTDIPADAVLTPTENRSAEEFDQEQRERRIEELVEDGQLAPGEDPEPDMLPPPFAATERTYNEGEPFSEEALLTAVDKLSRQGDVFVRDRLRFIAEAEALRRGPYDTMYGQRTIGTRASGGVFSEGDFLSDPPGYREPPAVDPALDPDRRYFTDGPQRWLVDTTPATLNDRLRNDLEEIARIKLSYVWPEPRASQDASTLLGFYLPDYEIDLRADNDRSADNSVPGFAQGDVDDRPVNQEDDGELSTIQDYVDAEEAGGLPGAYIRQTAFLMLDLYHREELSQFDLREQHNPPSGIEPNRPEWFIDRDGWQLITRPVSANDPRFVQVQRWFDLNDGPPLGRVRKRYSPPTGFNQRPEIYTYGQAVSGGYLYVEKVNQQTNPQVATGSYAFGAFPQLGLEANRDGNGNPVPTTHEYWRTRYYLLVGVNVGSPVPVEDPHEGFDSLSEDAPAPMGFDLEERTMQDLAEHGWSAYLAVARNRNPPTMGPGVFDASGSPMNGLMGVAQSRVFNNHSADLWTPMWSAQLEPVADLHNWALLMRQSARRAGLTATAAGPEMSGVAQELRRVAPVFDELGGH
ncbi:MAG: Tad domain-containing protein [Planctomycetota bacterium]